jgi:hypothetical protein
VSLLLAVGVGATGPTTINFGEYLADSAIDNEYASQGVRFGKAAAFGVTLPGAWDCGPPTVFLEFGDTSSGTGPVALAPVCGGRSGTVMAFAHPRRSIQLYVGELGESSRNIQARAHGHNGGLLTSEQVADGGTVAIERPSPDVSFLVVQLTGEGTSRALFDDLTFDHLGDPLTLSPRNVNATAGTARTDNVARLTDADPTAIAGDYKARIEWGDGGSSDGSLDASGDGYDVVGTHTYSAAGTFTVRTAVDKVNGVRATTTSTATVVDRPDFAVSVSPGTKSVAQGTSARFTVNVAPLAGFTGTVSLALSGASGSFAPASVTVPGSSQLTVATSAATKPGAYPLTISGAGGGLTRTATATLTVTKAAPSLVAAFTAPKRRPAFTLVTLDARRTKGATRYLWDLNGDKKPDVGCGGSTPVLVTRLRTPGRRTVSMTAVALGGQTSVARATVEVGKPPTGSGKAKGLLEIASCVRDARPYVEGVACAEKVVFGVVEAKGCFTLALAREDIPSGERRAWDEYAGDRSLADPLVSRGPVKLNGVGFFPSGGASIVLFPQAERIVSSRAEVGLGGITIRGRQDVNFALAATLVRSLISRPSGRARLLTFAATTPLPELGGFRLAGQAEVFLVKRGASYTSETQVSLALPSVFSLFGGTPPTGKTVLLADNDRGLVLDELSVRVPEANLGAIRMTDLSFEYKARGNPQFNCPRRWWKATVRVFLGGSESDGGFSLAPEPRRNGVAFCNGAFKSAGGELTFPATARPQLFPGIELKQVGFEIELDPTVVVGTATITAARLSDVTGALLMAFPSPSVPYTVEPGEAKGTLGRLVGRRFTSPTIAVGGSFSMNVLGLTIPFGNAYFAYSYPEYVAAGGGVRFPLPGMTVNVGVDGEMWLSRSIFSFHGFGEVCVAGLACLLRAEAWVTSTGFVVCGEIAGELHPGAGYRWGDAWPEIWLVDGCKPSNYWPQRPANAIVLAPYAAHATRTFTVQRGERTKNVRLEGLGGAPRIEVRGPTGELVSTASGDFVTGRTIRVLRQNAGKVTWIGVEKALPGRYTVKTLPGSAGIARLASTRNSDEHVRAKVTGKGSKRRLRYDVARVPGRRVTFFERGKSVLRPLGTVTGGRGSLRITTPVGAGGLREIVARVQLDGAPAPDRVVARYRVSSPSRLVRPRALRLRRAGSTVSASWQRVNGAAGYAVVLRLSSGTRRVMRVPQQRAAIRLRGILLTDAGAVSVRAVGPLGGWGPDAIGRFAAKKRLASPFRPFKELGRGSDR